MHKPTPSGCHLSASGRGHEARLKGFNALNAGLGRCQRLLGSEDLFVLRPNLALSVLK